MLPMMPASISSHKKGAIVCQYVCCTAGEEMELTGWAAWDAAVHCAACTASDQAPLTAASQPHVCPAMQPPASTLAKTMWVFPSLPSIASSIICSSVLKMCLNH